LATDDSRRGWINRVAVHPGYRRTGLGGELIRAAEAELRRRGIHIIAALIEEDNTASRSLFTKLEYLDMPEIRYYSKRDSWDV
jgi:ribosomal protein S18 acetylase RimI-like enzyme